MTTSDRAIAMAFCESQNEWFLGQSALIEWVDNRAREIDAADGPITDLHDRIEFALRDAGFGLDEASKIATLYTHAARDAEDAARLDWLDCHYESFGFEDVHEGNRWLLEGPFRTARAAIDAARAGGGGG